MSYNGSGQFNLSTPGLPLIPSTKAKSAVLNDVLTEIATGLSLGICRDGQSVITADLSMSDKMLKNLGQGSLDSDAARLSDVRKASLYISVVGGSANAILLTPTPNMTAYIVGQPVWFKAIADSTGAVTVNMSGLGVVNVKKAGGLDLVNGDIVNGELCRLTYDGTNFQLGASFYRQGTWTPSVGGSATYTTQSGIWVKQHRVMTISGHMQINTIGTGSTNLISGLPQPAASLGVNQALAVSDFGSLATNVVWIGARVNDNASTILLRNLTAAGASATSSALFGNGTYVTFNGSYMT